MNPPITTARQPADSMGTHPKPSAVLAGVASDRLVIQDFRPMSDSIDWELGQLYWDARGGGGFASHEVPFTVNNDGTLSAKAAHLLFQNLVEVERESLLEERIRVLEIGVGPGLFARFFLDQFRRLCAQHEKDYYHRLCYVASDRSSQMLQDLAAQGLLSEHSGHHEFQILDATRLDEPVHGSPSYRAVFLNYVLDSLAAALLEIGEQQIRQLYLRTCLGRCVNLRDHTNLDLAEIVRRAGSADPQDKQELVDLFHLFLLEAEFRDVNGDALPYLDFAVRFAHQHEPKLPYVLHSHGAMECLEKLLARLHPRGFILISDYGLTSPSEVGETYTYQHFGASTAIGLNFPLLKAYFTERHSCRWVEPEGESPRILARLLCRDALPETEGLFRSSFSRAAYDWANQPLETARARLKEGREEAALSGYQEALERQPDNWVLLAEAARYLSSGLHEHEAALVLARRALALNPASGQVWGTVGDCLVFLDRLEEAERSFLEALRLNPGDAGARYSLVHILMRRNETGAALQMIAAALLHDRTGEYRERLMQRQGEILARIDQMRQHRTRLLVNRMSGIVRR